jgi:hypothetical protein
MRRQSAALMLRRRLDPALAAPGLYRARYQGQTVLVCGPHRVYPSGLPHYTVLGDAAREVPAAHLDWVQPARWPRRAPSDGGMRSQSRIAAPCAPNVPAARIEGPVGTAEPSSAATPV